MLNLFTNLHSPLTFLFLFVSTFIFALSLSPPLSLSLSITHSLKLSLSSFFFSFPWFFPLSLRQPLFQQGDNYRRGDGFSTTRSVKKVGPGQSVPKRSPILCCFYLLLPFQTKPKKKTKKSITFHNTTCLAPPVTQLRTTHTHNLTRNVFPSNCVLGVARITVTSFVWQRCTVVQ